MPIVSLYVHFSDFLCKIFTKNLCAYVINSSVPCEYSDDLSVLNRSQYIISYFLCNLATNAHDVISLYIANE